MNKLLVVIPYHSGDSNLCRNLLQWIAELGKNQNACLLVGDQRIGPESRLAMKELALTAFNKVDARGIKTDDVLDRTNLAKLHQMANSVFRTLCTAINLSYKSDFLWMEPDCVPLCRGWLQKIEEAYGECQKRYMGAVIKTDYKINRSDMPPAFLAGCGVYPNNAINEANKLTSDSTAWDIALSQYVIPAAENTQLIQHFWGSAADKPPVFVNNRASGDPENYVTTQFLNPNAVLFHRVKDESLIKILRSQAQAKKQKRSQPTTELPQGMTTV